MFQIKLENLLKKVIQPAFLRPERAFLFAGLVWGICFLFLTPVNQVPDEGNHFLRACQVSRLDFVAETNGRTAGGMLPRGIAFFKYHYDSYVFDKTKHFPTLEIVKREKEFVLEGKEVFMEFPNTALYSPVCYVPQSLGISIARLLTKNLWWIFMAGRMCNLIFWVFSVYIAIRIIPHFQWLIAGISLIPMHVFQSASMSPDAVIFGVLVLFIAMVIFLGQSRNIQALSKRAHWLIPFFIIIPLCKNVYTPILCIALLIPWKVAGFGRREWILTGLLALASIATYVGWAMMVQSVLSEIHPIEHFYSAEPGVPKINPAAQLETVIQHPLGFLRICLHSVSAAWNVWYPTSIGYFGWLDIRLSNLYYHGMYAYLLILAVIHGQAFKKSQIFAPALLFSSAGIIILHFFLAMYLTWNSVGDQIIGNMQGRYFSPIAYLVLLGMAFISRFDLTRSAGLLVILVSGGSFVYSVISVFTYYYY